jgi:hypothetical protein
VAPEYGPFYTQGLVITDMATNLPLTSDQFYCAELETMASLETGLEVMRIIMITDQTVSANISLQYQVVGGEYSASAQAIIDQIYNLNLDDRPATWPAIIGKPAAFSPSAHMHDAGDLIGFEYTVAALDRISKAILLGDEASHDAIYQYIDLGTSSIASQIQALQNALNAHLADFTNPHKVTAAQVGAYTTQQSDANLSAAQTTLQTNINSVNAALTQHEANFSNPHKVTAAQVGTYTSAQIDGTTASLQNQINTKAPANPGLGGYVYAAAGQTVTLGDVHVNGTIYCANDIWAFWSDERLKTAIEPIRDPLKKIHQLNGVTYQHNELAASLTGTDTERRHMGLLAGDVYKVAPELTAMAAFDRDPATGLSISGKYYRTLQYDRAGALTIEAVKALDKKVDTLIAALKRTSLYNALSELDVTDVEWVTEAI